MVSFPLCRKACRPPGLGNVERARPDRLGLGRTPTTSGKRVQKKYVSVCGFRQIGLCFCSLSSLPPSLPPSPINLQGYPTSPTSPLATVSFSIGETKQDTVEEDAEGDGMDASCSERSIDEAIERSSGTLSPSSPTPMLTEGAEVPLTPYTP